MAKANELEVGGEYPVRSGPLAGHTVTVKTNVPRRDDQTNRRKIRVLDEDGKAVWLLPRVIATPTQAATHRVEVNKGVRIHTAPISAAGLRELAKLSTKGESPIVLLTLIGDWSDEDLATLTKAFGDA